MDFSKLKDMGRRYVDKARQIAEGLSDLEIKVEEATNDDKWGPHGQLMAEITKESFREVEYKEILAVIARRLACEPRQWRRAYKSLLLLEYMAKNGPERMVAELKSNQTVFNRLQGFEYIDEHGKDQGLNVRNRAKELWTLVNDPDHIAHERERAEANRNKYAGFDAKSVTTSAASAVRTSSSGMRTSSGTQSRGGGIPAAMDKPRSSDGEDPVAATRKRLEALKASEDESSGTLPDGAPPQVQQKKKLSDVKVDSNIAAALAKNFKAIAPPAPRPSTTAAPATSVQPAAQPNAAADLLAFDDPAPAPAPAPPAAIDDWAAFESVPAAATAPPAHATDPFGTAAKGGDDWSNFTGPSSTAAQSSDPLAGLTVVTPPAGSHDPFAAIAAPPSGTAESYSPGARSELPADIFSAPVVAPVSAGPHASPPAFAVAPGFASPPAFPAPAPGYGMAPPAYGAAPPFAQPVPTFGAQPGPMMGAPGAAAPHAAAFAAPGGAAPSMVPGFVQAGVMPATRPGQQHLMRGPSMGTTANMQMPAPLKKDPFADLF